MKRLSFVVATLCAIVNVAFAADALQVGSLEELLPLLKMDNVNVVMTPGTYRVTAADMKAGRYPSTSEVEEGNIRSVILLFEGNNNTFDFTDVTLEIEAEVFTNLDKKYREFVNLQTLGNYNVIKNLKIVDIADRDDFPNKGCTNIMVDGAHNRLEGIELRSMGSSPYGYGDMFGKGGGALMALKKHCGCLVRGDYNHLLNCKVIHKGFGHCIFMQGADHPTIEGCYVEGEMTTTDKVLAEEGTGSKADKLDFMTTHGYRVPPGHTIACTEEGIRAYISGNTMVDGVRYKRGTTNITVKDCYVKSVRGGIILSHGGGEKRIENCTVIGCERAYAVGTGRIINCKADVQHGPALVVAYERDHGTEADITLLPYRGESYNGSKHAALIIGSDHKIRFRRGEGLVPDEELQISIGGDNRTIGSLGKDQNHMAQNITIINESGYPIVLDDNTSKISVTTDGELVDNGTDNKLVPKEEANNRPPREGGSGRPAREGERPSR